MSSLKAAATHQLCPPDIHPQDTHAAQEPFEKGHHLIRALRRTCQSSRVQLGRTESRVTSGRCQRRVARAPAAGEVPIMARRRTISRGKLALEDAMAATAPNIIVMCAGTASCPVDCAHHTTPLAPQNLAFVTCTRHPQQHMPLPKSLLRLSSTPLLSSTLCHLNGSVDVHIMKTLIVTGWQSSIVGRHANLLVSPLEAIVGAQSDGGVGNDAQNAGAKALRQRQGKLLSNSLSCPCKRACQGKSTCQDCRWVDNM